jgi:CP family cyanate transporter-like MFS transporter
VSAAGRGPLVLGILLIAACLRAPFTGLPPVLAGIRADFDLGTTAAGALTALPLLAFAIVSPWSGGLARRFGLERTLFGALLAIAAGIALRSSGDAGPLYAGTALIGTGIAVGNVLLPSLVKRDFAHSVASLTSIYAITMGMAAALASSLATPMAQAWGWRVALATFAILPVGAALAWSLQLASRNAPATGAAACVSAGKVWRSALAWQVTLFFGLNSVIYYTVIAWLPTILVHQGASPARAGSLHGLLQLATAAAGPLLWLVLKRVHDHRVPAVACALLSAAGLLGLLWAPALASIAVCLIGLGTGACVILGLTFMSLRAGSVGQAASLSGMAQCVGYLLAAAGPTAMGGLHDALDGWAAPLAICAAMALAIAALGLFAGRRKQIA